MCLRKAGFTTEPKPDKPKELNPKNVVDITEHLKGDPDYGRFFNPKKEVKD